jgi:hypothetical protein
MKKLGFTVSILLTSLIGISQDVSYKKVFDDPDKVAPLKITLDPLFYDMIGANFVNVGFGARANYSLKKIATIDLSHRIGIVDANSEPGAFVHSYTEVIGTYHLKDKTSNANLPVTLSSSSNGSTTTTKYINVPAKKRKIIGVRAGFYKSHLNLELGYEKYKTPFFGVNDAGATFTIPTDYEFGNLSKPSEFKTQGMNTFVLDFGASYKSITNLKVQTDYSRRPKKHRRENDIYFDVLVGMKTKFNDITTEDGTVWHMDNASIKKLGWRFGYIMKRGAFSYKTEFAVRPGVKGGNFSMLQVLGFTIPVKLGVKPEILN